MPAMTIAASTALMGVPMQSTAPDALTDSMWLVIVKAIVLLVFLLVTTLACIVIERKVVGRMQTRPGPNMNGPFGSLQSLADAMKLLFKEDITVKNADKIVYIVAPMIAVFGALLTFAVIPLGPTVTIPFTDISTPLQLTDIPVAGLYILACASVGVYGIVLGGWSSGSTYPLLGAVRSTAQVISYELAMGMSLVSVFLVSGSMSTSQIVDAQTGRWWAFVLAPAFVVYVISMVGETNRAPFDLPEAEGELVGGFHTEYSSMKFAWFFFAEYVNMINVSAVATTLFLGGWHAPWPLMLIGDGVLNTGWWPLLWFIVKMWAFLFLFIWLRGTLPRFRYDQFMNFGWKFLIPVALVWIVIVAVGRGIGIFTGVDLTQYAIPAVIVLIVIIAIWFIIDYVRSRSARQAAELPDTEPFEPFADGFPVPPLPGQQVPPSPRRQRTPAAIGAPAPSPSKEDTDA